MTVRCRNHGDKGTMCEGSWVVLDRNCNYSAFSGYHRTPSNYSAVKCLDCGTVWRTKAD